MDINLNVGQTCDRNFFNESKIQILLSLYCYNFFLITDIT